MSTRTNNEEITIFLFRNFTSDANNLINNEFYIKLEFKSNNDINTFIENFKLAKFSFTQTIGSLNSVYHERVINYVSNNSFIEFISFDNLNRRITLINYLAIDMIFP